MKIGFIGLGNAGGQLASSILRNGYDLMVRDLSPDLVADFVSRGARSALSARELAQHCDVIITCLPSPQVCSQVMEADDGVLAGISPGNIWLEMSTTDEAEMRRIAVLVEAKGAMPVDCPVSGGCHRSRHW